MYSAVVEAIAQMLRQFFNWRTSVVDNMAIDEVIDDKQDNEKAIRYASKALSIAQKYIYKFEKNDKVFFKYYLKKFRNRK